MEKKYLRAEARSHAKRRRQQNNENGSLPGQPQSGDFIFKEDPHALGGPHQNNENDPDTRGRRRGAPGTVPVAFGE